MSNEYLERKIKDFLDYHKGADTITFDQVSNIPYSATYTTVDGKPRTFPVTYYFDTWREG